MSRVLVAGSMALDRFVHYEGSFLDGIRQESLEHLSVSFSVARYEERDGGSGANVAWNLRLLHQELSLLSAVGKDGQAYVDRLHARGIDTSLIYVSSTLPTANAVIATDEARRQITFFYVGAEMEPNWLKPETFPTHFSRAIVTPWKPIFTLPALRWCKEKGIPCIFDPGQHILGFTVEQFQEAIDCCQGLMMNTYEWQLIEERMGTSKEALLQKIPFIIITHGEEGFFVYEPGTEKHYPACTPDTIVNPTGAGDAFRAGVLTGLERGLDLAVSAQLGAALASKVVEVEGALLPSVDMAEISGRVEKAYGTKIEP
jgi:adenosine kinase